jgi:2,3-bisphosphoglycerate-independent phosphoglycerate mutase
MDDYSAGHISTPEAAELIGAVDARLGAPDRRFHPGVGYRHLLVWRDGPVDVRTQPPHDIAGKPAGDYLPGGPRAAELRELMESSKDILATHPVNRRRRDEGKKEATQIWLWGQGRRMAIRSYRDLYGREGGVVSAVDLVRGLGRLAGLEAPKVPGATGFLDTNFEGKVEALQAILRRGSFVYLHLEAPDECGHIGDVAKKVRACELFDERIVGPVWRRLEATGAPYRLVVAMDHRTPCAVRGHTMEPVPMARLDGPVGAPEAEAPFDETVHGGKAECMAYDWIRELLSARA